MFTEIPEDVIESIRGENDIVEVIEEYVQLKKQGRNYFGLCPFHSENSPSFSVTKEKQIFHCFGCGKGGNVITFLMEMETFTFIEAIQFLANRAGIQLPETRSNKTSLSDEDQQLLSAYDWLTKYYHHLLKYADDGKLGLEYFQNRGLNENTMDEFQLGIAPLNSEFTVQFLEKKGFHPQLLVKAGLLSPRENNEFVDPFRGRIMFPIKNHLGKTVGFGARALQDQTPKYLNSPEHALFHKGSILYNFNLAKNHIRKQNEVILFEGYMDVITAYQAGIKNVVATLGTSLTEHQARLLKRYVDTIIICYDADEAGVNASYQAATLLKNIGCEVKVAEVKNNMDPDEYISAHGGEEFIKQVIDYSKTYFKFFMYVKKRDYNLSIDSERIAYIEEIIKQLATIESPIEREYYVNEIATEFNLSTEIIQYDINQYKKRNNLKDNTANNSNTNTKPYTYQKVMIQPAYQNAERKLMAHMFKHPFIIDKVQEKLGVGFNIDHHKIILTHLYALYEEKNTVNVSELIDKLEDDSLKKIVTELALTQVNDAITEEEINDYIHQIKMEATDITYLRTLREKQKSEQNPILAAKIGLEIIEIEKQLKKMK
ncbi:DNA primase [Pseudogracilibacillus sp. SE30717A]|uniref:DNA primase n=1 Tax=Pseudogracilibacillus sp. SE30717A TaxID=3098293 RepID=UPI00300E172D